MVTNRAAWLLPWILMSGSLGTAAAQDAPLPDSATREALRSAWETRVRPLADAAATWRYSIWHAAGTQMPSSAWFAAHGGDESLRPPLQPFEGAGEASVELAAGTLLYRRRGPEWIAEPGEFYPRSQTIFRDDRGLGILFEPVPGVAESDAVLRSSSETTGIGLLALPVVAMQRPFDKTSGPFHNWDEWILSDSPVIIADQRCQALEHRQEWYHAKLSTATYVRRAYVDSARDHALVRWTEWGGGQLIVQIDIDYAEHGDAWLPSGWHTQIFRAREPHDLIEEQTVSEVRWQRGDVPAPPEFVELLPARTLLRDERSGSAWLVRPDGTLRGVTRDELERRVSRDELLALPTGWGGRPLAYRAFQAAGWFGPPAGLLFAATLIYWRLKRGDASRQASVGQ